MRQILRILLASLLLASGLPVAADSDAPSEPQDPRRGVVDSVSDSLHRGWDATREGVGNAVDVTREKAARGWEKTREMAGATADWTREKSGQAWEATRDGAAATADWMREKTGAGNSADTGRAQQEGL